MATLLSIIFTTTSNNARQLMKLLANSKEKSAMKYTSIILLTCLSIPSFRAGAQMNQFAGLNQNYVVTNNIQASGVTSQAGVNGLTAQGNSQTIQYFDGLGR